ncbi:hypothetical protein V8G54_008760 [Vigna mungo]|uniref:Ubiquitin-like protease family profile domain-containing protein n=1 Tax=Vigna mungo TaxID=3915 RepID=A0AAQ3S9I0_VIGMU
MAGRWNLSVVDLDIPNVWRQGEYIGSYYWFESDLLFPEFMASNSWLFFPPPNASNIISFQNVTFCCLSELARLNYPHSRQQGGTIARTVNDDIKVLVFAVWSQSSAWRHFHSQMEEELQQVVLSKEEDNVEGVSICSKSPMAPVSRHPLPMVCSKSYQLESQLCKGSIGIYKVYHYGLLPPRYGSRSFSSRVHHGQHGTFLDLPTSHDSSGYSSLATCLAYLIMRDTQTIDSDTTIKTATRDSAPRAKLVSSLKNETVLSSLNSEKRHPQIFSSVVDEFRQRYLCENNAVTEKGWIFGRSVAFWQPSNRDVSNGEVFKTLKVQNFERLRFFVVDVVELDNTSLTVELKMVPCKSNWRMRAWMDASYIIQMNSLLQLRHQNRIFRTPFKICLRIHDSIQLNLQLLKLLDVVMSLGFGVGGLEVPLDESIVGKVGEHFSDCKTTELDDMMTLFNVLVHNDDVDVDVDVDVLWAYERLGLYAHTSHKVFPRILRFHSVNYDAEEIDALLKRGEVSNFLNMLCCYCCDLWSSDLVHVTVLHCYRYILIVNPIIRVAFNLDGVGRADGSSRGGEPLQGEGEESSELPAVDKIRRNTERIRSVRNEIVVVRKELSDLRKLRKFGYVDNLVVEGERKEDCGGEEVPAEAPVQAAGPANKTAEEEAPASEEPGNEGAANEAAANEGLGNEAPPDEGVGNEAAADEGFVNYTTAIEGCVNEGPTIKAAADEAYADEVIGVVAPVDEECVGEFSEEAAHKEGGDEACEAHEKGAFDAHDEGAAHADEEASAKASCPFVEIGDDDDDGGHVEPKLVVPLRSYNGDPKTTVNLDILYNTVTRVDIGRRYVSEIMAQLLTTAECHSLGRRECVDNMSHVLIDYKKKLCNQHVWQLHDYQAYFRSELVKVEDLLSADWVFIPIVSSEHWWCYALKVGTFELFVIDSLEKGIKGRCWIDRTIAQKMQRLWALLTNSAEDSKCPLVVQKAKIPEKFDGKSMPDYTNVGINNEFDELAGFRMKLIWDWIMDEENVRRIDTLHDLGLI